MVLLLQAPTGTGPELKPMETQQQNKEQDLVW